MAAIIKQRIPITWNADGVILVGGTRVPLDTVRQVQFAALHGISVATFFFHRFLPPPFQSSPHSPAKPLPAPKTLP